MNGYPKKLRNTDGQIILPVTHSDVVYVSDTKKLTQKLSEIDQSILTGIASNKWAGKTWNVIGDSITEHNFRTTKNYHDYITDKIGCTVNNYGVSGTGWRTPSATGGTNAIYQRLESINTSADLITVFAGTNDWAEVGLPMTLGSLGDTSPSTSFFGAVDYVLNQLITKYPTKTIAVFTPLPRSDAWFNLPHGTSGITMENVADAIIAVANKYNIPFLDLYRTSSLFPWNATANDTYFKAVSKTSGDGLHPNDAGHQLLADKILAFLNTL